MLATMHPASKPTKRSQWLEVSLTMIFLPASQNPYARIQRAGAASLLYGFRYGAFRGVWIRCDAGDKAERHSIRAKASK